MTSNDSTPDDSTPREDAAPGTASTTSPGAWAASTDRPQYATHTHESAPADAGSSTDSADDDQSRNMRPSAGVERLVVRAVGRRVRIVGEPGVATVSADGPHVTRRNQTAIEVSSDGEFGSSVNGFQLLRGAPRSLDDVRSLGLGKELFLRVNPSLLVDCEVIAGSLRTEGVPRLGTVRVTAGGGHLTGVTELADVLLQAGHTTIEPKITSGRSRIRVESGSLNLSLRGGSDVSVHSESRLGKVTWSGDQAGIAADEVVLGSGRARLDVEVVMGHATIRS